MAEETPKEFFISLLRKSGATPEQAEESWHLFEAYCIKRSARCGSQA